MTGRILSISLLFSRILSFDIDLVITGARVYTIEWLLLCRGARARDLKYSPARSFTKKRPVGDEWTGGKDGSFIHTGKEKKWHHRPHQLCESRTPEKRGSLRHAFLYTSIHNISLYYHFVDTIISVYRIFLKKIKVNMCHLDISRGTIHIYKYPWRRDIWTPSKFDIWFARILFWLLLE